jgi:hypothetical protein
MGTPITIVSIDLWRNILLSCQQIVDIATSAEVFTLALLIGFAFILGATRPRSEWF